MGWQFKVEEGERNGFKYYGESMVWVGERRKPGLIKTKRKVDPYRKPPSIFRRAQPLCNRERK